MSRRGVELELRHLARQEVLDEHVGPICQPVGQRHIIAAGQVERDAALVAMEVHEIRAVARSAEAFAALAAIRHLDLDDIGAPIGELAHAGGP